MNTLDPFDGKTGDAVSRDSLGVGGSIGLPGSEFGNDHFTFQGGTGADSQSGQKLITIEMFTSAAPSGCITQFSALLQTN